MTDRVPPSVLVKAGALALALGLALSWPPQRAEAGHASPDVGGLARRWDHINFEIRDRDEAQAEAAELEREAAALARATPEQPGPLIWQAMAVLAKADSRRDFASLGLAKRARVLLEKAMTLGAQGEDAAFVEAVLGTLYDNMPGFPLGFGDRRQAQAWFSKAIAAAPDDIDVGVLYGDHLLHQKDFVGAVAAYRRALQAHPRPGREIDDRYRRGEAEAHMAVAQRRQAAH